MSQIRVNFPEDCENVMNQLLHKFQEVAEVYQAMACHFMRDDVTNCTFEMLLWRRSDTLRQRITHMIRYLNKRGGRVQFAEIPKPQQTEWKNMVDAMLTKVNLEKDMHQLAEQLYKVAQKTNDSETQELVHAHILPELTMIIKKIGDSITTLKKNGEGLGEFLFTQHVLEPIVAKQTVQLMSVTPYVYPRFIKEDTFPMSPVNTIPRWNF